MAHYTVQLETALATAPNVRRLVLMATQVMRSAVEERGDATRS